MEKTVVEIVEQIKRFEAQEEALQMRSERAGVNLESIRNSIKIINIKINCLEWVLNEEGVDSL